MQDNNQYVNIPREKFEFANHGERITDHKFVDKPIGYFKDAWIRFCRNKASIVAAIIILIIVLFAFLTPLLTVKYDATFLDTYYQKMGPRNLTLKKIGMADGGIERKFSEKGLISIYAIGMGALDYDGKGVTLAESLDSEYQPVIKNNGLNGDANNPQSRYEVRVDTYLEVGFLYLSIEREEYDRIVEWEKQTGKHVLYPLVEINEYNPDPTSTKGNYWYKANSKYEPVRVLEDGSVKKIKLSDNMILEDNYKRNADGSLKYYEYTGGGTTETAMYKVRVLYYNYYQFKNGFEPEYIFGTDSQGYDMSLRLANGVRLSLLVSVCVSVINFVIGAVYGAVQGYYGGTIDLVLDRISDVLSGVPFIVVATLFQIHLAAKVGAIPSLLFAFVLTGWIGTSALVRKQFYRFKNSEYVMAARTLGASDRRIIMKHIFPNSLGTIITSSVLVIPGVIFSESMLSFLGIIKLGGSTTTSLGTLLSDASSIWTNYPHLMLFPALIISLLEISFNLFGNGLRDAFNPSLRGVEE
ncbi:MAG: ABC transporter permease [Eubacteriales bacterium]|nr:ABC transporter permease [Eubacteriales bacterium]